MILLPPIMLLDSDKTVKVSFETQQFRLVNTLNKTFTIISVPRGSKIKPPTKWEFSAKTKDELVSEGFSFVENALEISVDPQAFS